MIPKRKHCKKGYFYQFKRMNHLLFPNRLIAMLSLVIIISKLTNVSSNLISNLKKTLNLVILKGKLPYWPITIGKQPQSVVED